MSFLVISNKTINKPIKRNNKHKKKNSANRTRSNTAFLFSSPVSGILYSPTVAIATFLHLLFPFQN